MNSKNSSRGSRGASLAETVVFIAILGLVLGISALNLRPMASPLSTGVSLTEGFVRQARSTAMVSTSAYRIRPVDSTHMMAESAPYCSSATWTADPELYLQLPGGVSLANTGWNLCFTSRGVTTSNVVVELLQEHADPKRIEVLWGGATRVLP